MDRQVIDCMIWYYYFVFSQRGEKEDGATLVRTEIYVSRVPMFGAEVSKSRCGKTPPWLIDPAYLVDSGF